MQLQTRHWKFRAVLGHARARRQVARGPEALEQRLCPAAGFRLEPVVTTVREGQAAILRAHLTAASKQPHAVLLTTTAETAQLGSDYMQFATRITFAPGETVKEYRIQTLGDVRPAIEGPETFLVTVTPQNPSSSPLTARVTITDVIPQSISTTSINVREGNSGTTTATFTVSLSRKSIHSIMVHYATREGSATVADGDYVAANGTLSFKAGEVAKTVSVTIKGDTKIEPGEYFSLDFSNATSGYFIATPTVTCTIVNDDSASVPTPTPATGAFQIDLTYGADVPQSVKTAARAAADRWQQIITADLPDVTDAGAVIDDITIDVGMGLLSGNSDGLYGTLAQAGVVRLRAGTPGLPWKSRCGIDTADASNPQLVTVLTHEFGHALGFPSGRAFTSYISNGTFTGPNALREYKVFFPNATSIPMDDTQGHWGETQLGNEIMTPMMNATNRLSRITIGAMQDAGYTVDYTKADTFVPLPLALSAPTPATGATTSLRQGSVVWNLRASASGAAPLTAMTTTFAEATAWRTNRELPGPFAAPVEAVTQKKLPSQTVLSKAFANLLISR